MLFRDIAKDFRWHKFHIRFFKFQTTCKFLISNFPKYDYIINNINYVLNVNKKKKREIIISSIEGKNLA